VCAVLTCVRISLYFCLLFFLKWVLFVIWLLWFSVFYFARFGFFLSYPSHGFFVLLVMSFVISLFFVANQLLMIRADCMHQRYAGVVVGRYELCFNGYKIVFSAIGMVLFCRLF
jgi:hypothetical protein